MDQSNDTPAHDPDTPHGSFLRKEDGTIVFFAMIVMIVMFMLGGMGVDIMRFEATRTELQQTADRATLAAASVTQRLHGEDVVNDYFVKAGLAGKLTKVEVTNGINFRTVRTEARANTNPIFLRLYDKMVVDQMEAKAISVAYQQLSDVEIILVLDVSGSMGGAKIANLKTAAKEFIDTVLDADTENRISIGIVPYNAQVNIPPILKAQFNLTNDNGITNASCVELPESAFINGPISRTTPFAMSAFADVVTGPTSRTDAFRSASLNKMKQDAAFCRDQAQNLIMLPSRNAASLKSKIDSLSAGGNTSITLGMKWGVTLVDPSMKTAYTAFVAAEAVPSQLAGRPYDYHRPDTMKVIVVMTDGEHVQHSFVPDAYKTGTSPIWRAPDGNYSIRHTSGLPGAAESKTYWVPHLGEWQTAPHDDNAIRQNWEDVWADVRMTWVAWQLYARALGTNDTSRNSVYGTWTNTFKDNWLSASKMDTSLQKTCNFARTNGVIVYGIAFQAPQSGTTQIRNCSSSPEYFFNAEDKDEIETAFRAIASNITQLRLTQ
jgi:Mg-chelatase subunit ChlD